MITIVARNTTLKLFDNAVFHDLRRLWRQTREHQRGDLLACFDESLCSILVEGVPCKTGRQLVPEDGTEDCDAEPFAKRAAEHTDEVTTPRSYFLTAF